MSGEWGSPEAKGQRGAAGWDRGQKELQERSVTHTDAALAPPGNKQRGSLLSAWKRGRVTAAEAPHRRNGRLMVPITSHTFCSKRK